MIHGMSFYEHSTHGFLRAAVAMPRVHLGEPRQNLARILASCRRASELGAGVVLFPELSLSGYSLEDLHQQRALLAAVEDAAAELVAASRELAPVIVVGAPLATRGALYNTALVIARGQLLGIVPKTYLPNYREFYERRQFTPGGAAVEREVSFLGAEVPFGADLLFAARNLPGFVLHAEICEDLWVPIAPSSWAALAGATVLLNLSASNAILGKATWRRTLAASASGRLVAAYLYSAAGEGESTTELAWDGHALIYENGELLAESERFVEGDGFVVADLDLERLAQERLRLTSFHDCAAAHKEQLRSFRRIGFDFVVPEVQGDLCRPLARFPYVPAGNAERDERCFEAYHIQVHGLEQRLRATGIDKVVIGVSGGLDSTQALIVAVKAMDRLGLPRTNVLAYTMPGFGTTDHTYRNAWALMRALGVGAAEIDVRPSCRQMLADLGHPFARGEAVYDTTFENVQAGERTSHLFRLANHHHALVVGTGDLSELALGWTTYGVGDQMSHYNVNGSVPKTLIQYLIRWVVASRQFDGGTNEVLASILATAISPELVPGVDGKEPAQRTEDVIGPYELQDFNLYYLSRFGFKPSKVAFLALAAWGDAARGEWPADLPPRERRAYDLVAIKRWLDVFLVRFFATSQFKRSAMPNAPKVGSGGSLSPRGDWRAPSDSSAVVWVEELRAKVP